MSHRGFSHIGLSTLDLDKRVSFTKTYLALSRSSATPSRSKRVKIRHIFFDTGHDQPIAFMEARDVPGVPGEYDAGINRGLGLPGGIYHFAFEAGNEAALVQKREELLGKGIKVSGIVDHNWSKSIYFKDTNGIALEYCCLTREFNENDARMQDRFKISVTALQDPVALPTFTTKGSSERVA